MWGQNYEMLGSGSVLGAYPALSLVTPFMARGHDWTWTWSLARHAYAWIVG